VIINDLLDWLNVAREPEFFFVHLDINSGITIGGREWVVGDQCVSEVVGVTDE
jgi:hypothetical protein